MEMMFFYQIGMRNTSKCRKFLASWTLLNVLNVLNVLTLKESLHVSRKKHVLMLMQFFTR